MANNFLTVQEIADQTLLRLRENEVMSMLVWRNWDGDFAQKKGELVIVKKPNTFTAEKFETTINPQIIDEDYIPIRLNELADTSVEVTAKEMTLNLSDFTEQIINPAVESLASYVDKAIMELYKDVPAYVGASGTTPDELADFANAVKVLNVNKAPMGNRTGVWDPSAQAEFMQVEALVNAEKSGTTETLRMGAIGRVYNLDNYMSQNVPTHVAGGYTVLTDVTAAVTAASNAKDDVTGFNYSTATLTSTAGASTAKLLKGDILTIGGVQVTVLEDTANASSGVVAAKVVPPFSADVAAGAVVFADVTAGAHVSNLVFNKNAFALVIRPLELPIGGAESAVASFEGLSIRVTRGYDMEYKKNIISFDMLFGVKTLMPELAVRVLG